MTDPQRRSLLGALGAFALVAGLLTLMVVGCPGGAGPYDEESREGQSGEPPAIARAIQAVLGDGDSDGPPPIVQKLLPGANPGPLGSSHQGPLRTAPGEFVLGMTTLQFPWQGELRTDDFDLTSDDSFEANFDFEVDLHRVGRYLDDLDEVYVVLVGEPVYRQDGSRTGFSGITLTTRKTVAGIPLEFYEGTLPVHAFGSKRGSPFEDVVAFPVSELGDLTKPVRLAGSLSTSMQGVPTGWYRPHVEIFAKLKGSEKRLDLRHLGISLGRWVDDRATSMAPALPSADPFNPIDMKEFMKSAQVLPNVAVGAVDPPRLIFTLFSDAAASGQSGLMANEDHSHAGVSNRSRFPTPFVLPPGMWPTTPGMPAEFPSTGLAGLFQGFGSLSREVESWLQLQSGQFSMWVTGPDGQRRSLGDRSIRTTGDGGLELEGGPFPVALGRTGEYTIELEGCFKDVRGRELCGGGTYELTCALPMTFSTAVKPGTNFLVGARYPAIMDINPAVSAHVTTTIDWYPNSEEERHERWVVEGDATHFGYFAPENPPPRFEEPGEYRSLLDVRWTDRSGNLWLGTQSSAGVVAPAEGSEVSVHGARSFIFDPHPEMDRLGSFERFNLPFEGGSSFAEHSNLSLYDHTFPYWSGDTLLVPTTYPLESVIGPTLSMAARSPAMLERFEDALLPNGPLAPYPMASRNHEISYLPHVFKISEDNFSYHLMEPGLMDAVPILGASSTGFSPYAWPEDADFDAYVYLSVIRPGLPVLSMAFSGSFMAPCWIISPNDYGYRFHSSPNGDLPEDIYRVMAGLVVRDKTTGETHYDAYSSAIRITPPGSGFTAVQPPGELPIMHMAGKDHFTFLGLNTSGVFETGHELLLGGTLMPPAAADVTFTISHPSGFVETMEKRANRLGGVSPPRPITMEEPGVYKVKVDIETENQAGEIVKGDVVGSGDGEILYFVLDKDNSRIFASPLPAISEVEVSDRIPIPLGFRKDLKDARLYWSAMTPGSLFDEGWIDLDDDETEHDFIFRPRQTAIQLPNFDTVDFGTGEGLLTDIFVFVFYVEGTINGEPVYDALRVVMRGDHLINPDALIQPEILAEVGIDVGEAWGQGAGYPKPSYTKDVDLDGLHVGNREATQPAR